MDNLEIAYNAEKFRPKNVVTSDECYGCCGTAGFLIAADQYIKSHTDDLYGRCEQVPDMRSCLSSGAMEQGSS